MTLLKTLKNHRWDRKTTAWLVLVHLGCLGAPFFFTWPAFFVCLGLYFVIGGLGISLCYHRLLTHRSFKTPKAVEYILTVIGCLAAQRSPIYWVARHRRHHAFADREGDPHTPRQGLLWSHMLWPAADLRVPDENAYYMKNAPDLARDPGHRWIQKTHEIWPLALAAVLLAVGGLPFLFWGFFVQMVLVYHGTWMVNSLGHRFGYKNYKTSDDARNNPFIAMLSFGEGWHNNHHAHPALAHHGHRFWEVDYSYAIIRIMGLLGLASEIRSDLGRTLFAARIK